VEFRAFRGKAELTDAEASPGNTSLLGRNFGKISAGDEFSLSD
jgi:hypothetical protein